MTRPAPSLSPEDPAADAAAGLCAEIAACRLCSGRFAATATAHAPRPVVWFRPSARVLIASQAPGMRAHAAGVPFHDPSGQRLRAWMGLDEAAFYDRETVAIVPMAFCFPGYDAAGSDLPPPSVCAATWRARALASLPGLRMTLLVGGAAQRWHLGTRAGVTATVADWRRHAARGLWPLPHPSWRNTAWLARNPWFEAELLPALRPALRDALS
ncbi:MAG: uracil-DNA glycosylase family protein [Alkalilacustris sp.]